MNAQWVAANFNLRNEQSDYTQRLVVGSETPVCPRVFIAVAVSITLPSIGLALQANLAIAKTLGLGIWIPAGFFIVLPMFVCRWLGYRLEGYQREEFQSVLPKDD